MYKDLSIGLIEYLWTSGSYELKDMIKLVNEGIISEEEFHDITRYNFKGVIDIENGEDE